MWLVLEKSAALDNLVILKPLLDARFPPYTNFKKTLIKLFSKEISTAAVNVPVPAFRFIARSLGLYFVLYLLPSAAALARPKSGGWA